MKNPTLDNIKKGIATKLQNEFGYCSIADSDDVAVLYSGNGDDNFVITIKDQSAIDSSKPK